MYLFIMYCICNRKLKKKKGREKQFVQNLLLGELGTAVVRLRTLYDHFQDHISYYKEWWVLLWCVATKPEDTSWEVIQPFLDVVNEQSSMNTAMNEWGQEECRG